MWERVLLWEECIVVTTKQGCAHLSPQHKDAYICHRRTIAQRCIFVTTRPGCPQPARLSLKNAKLCICSKSGHTLKFDDQLMKRLLGAIMWSGYVVGGAALVHICGYKASDCSSVKMDQSGIIELEGNGQRQNSVLINQILTGFWTQILHLLGIKDTNTASLRNKGYV